MKKASSGRAARRAAGTKINYPAATPEYLNTWVTGKRMAGELFTRDDIEGYLLKKQEAGQLFTMEDVVEMLNNNTRQAVQIVFTAMMEQHFAGASRIYRDLDPAVMEIYREMEKAIKDNGLDYAEDKIRERYEKAKRQTFRRIKGLEERGLKL